MADDGYTNEQIAVVLDLTVSTARRKVKAGQARRETHAADQRRRDGGRDRIMDAAKSDDFAEVARLYAAARAERQRRASTQILLEA
jgi:transposase